jgi:Tfp pilus assembly protein PilF
MLQLALAALLATATMTAEATPDRSRTYLEEGRRLAAKGDLKGAQIQLRNSVQQDPANAVARIELARIMMALKDDLAAAEGQLRAAAELGHSPDEVDPLLGAAQQRLA